MARLVESTRFALVKPRSACSLRAEATAGSVNVEVALTEGVFEPVLDALAGGPATAAELRGELAALGLGADQLRQALCVLAAVSYIEPALPSRGEAERRASTDRFNSAMLARAATGQPVPALASPVLGSGVPLDAIELSFLAAYRKGLDPVEHARRVLMDAQRGHGQAVDQQEAIERSLAQVDERAGKFLADRVPVLEQLGVV
jgi:hypothetical protein